MHDARELRRLRDFELEIRGLLDEMTHDDNFLTKKACISIKVYLSHLDQRRAQELHGEEEK